MIRPYLAVLVDSFHAALASRVLWVALVAIWVLIAVLAPIGYREDFTTDFQTADFNAATALKSMLAERLVDPQAAETAVGRIAAALPEDLQRQLRQVGQGAEVRIRVSTLADGLNTLLEDESWYDATAWESSHRLSEQRELDELPDRQLSDSLRRRRARLRIESVLPGAFRARSSRSIIVTYAGMDFPSPIPGNRDQFETVINQFVMPFIIDWALGFALILVGILVTASIIPDMLQPGALHLLLSKPISRPLLLLSKFLGGCAFVFLCVVQLIVGLYLIAGWRLDIWNARLLLCIPVSVYSFSVFYSISLVAGLRWRSSIMAIGVTTICGVFFLLVGFFLSIFDALITDPARLRGVVMVDGVPLAATAAGGLIRFGEGTNRWVDLIPGEALGADRVLNPVRLTDSMAATAVVKDGRFNLFGAAPLDLMVLSKSNQWQGEPSLRLPAGTSDLLRLGSHHVLAVNASDLAVTHIDQVLRAAGQREDASEREDAGEDAGKPGAPGRAAAPNWLVRLTESMGAMTDGFVKILPSGISVSAPRETIAAADGSAIIVISGGRLLRLEPPAAAGETTWNLTASRTLSGEPSAPGKLALSGDVLLVSRGAEPLRFFASRSLAPLAHLQLNTSFAPSSLAGLGDGRFALVTTDGHCQIVRPVGDDLSQFRLTRRLPIADVLWAGVDPNAGTLAVVHHIDQIDVLRCADLSTVRTIRPSLGRWRLIDRYGMTPLRILVPQTGKLSETIASIISGKTGVAIPSGPNEGEVIQYNIFRPVVSCAIFIGVMLTIGCVYFSTRDF